MALAGLFYVNVFVDLSLSGNAFPPLPEWCGHRKSSLVWVKDAASGPGMSFFRERGCGVRFCVFLLESSDKKRYEMKVRASVKRRCEFCQIIKRNGTIRVICSRDARHKQRQG